MDTNAQSLFVSIRVHSWFINKTLFGWTVPLLIPWEQLSSIPLLLLT